MPQSTPRHYGALADGIVSTGGLQAALALLGACESRRPVARPTDTPPSGEPCQLHTVPDYADRGLSITAG